MSKTLTEVMEANGFNLTPQAMKIYAIQILAKAVYAEDEDGYYINAPYVHEAWELLLDELSVAKPAEVRMDTP